jgi:hypothetical protein
MQEMGKSWYTYYVHGFLSQLHGPTATAMTIVAPINTISRCESTSVGIDGEEATPTVGSFSNVWLPKYDSR